jgi:hypothetical protein
MRVVPGIFLFGAVISVGLAQYPSGTPKNSRPAQSANERGRSATVAISGCINGGHNRFTMTQQSTGAIFGLQGQETELENARGRLVEVKGDELPPPGGGGLKNLPQLKVRRIRVVADKCPIQTEVRHRPELPREAGPSKPATAATPEYGAPGAVDQTPPTVGNNPTNWGNGAQGAPSPGTGNTAPAPSKPPQ